MLRALELSRHVFANNSQFQPCDNENPNCATKPGVREEGLVGKSNPHCLVPSNLIALHLGPTPITPLDAPRGKLDAR
jgi:hypothetical protein